MILLNLKQHIESFPDYTQFKYSLSEPFSWRGSYDEVAFAVYNSPSTKEEMLECINKAYTNKFEGYKGGEFSYNDYTDVNFEESIRDYSDGSYTMSKIAMIKESETYQSTAHELISLMFPKDQ